MIFKIFIFLFFVLSPELKSEIVVDPGEMIAIKTASCPDVKNKKVFFYVVVLLSFLTLILNKPRVL